MTPSPKPIAPEVRLAIARWDDNAPRGAVTAFCNEHGISRKSFYTLRKRARTHGVAAVLEPQSRRPHTSPQRITDTVKKQAIAVRDALKESGLDCGPISVHDKMTAMGLDSPSIASLARVFRDAGVAREEPRKKPRSAFRRFVYPAPNACWQLDATEYVLAGGRRCVIFQLQDDHSRLAVASLVAQSETSAAAIKVLKAGIKKHGVPQRLLTDNGAALNSSRRGATSRLSAYANSRGILTITGKPYRPTTQGKNERFHQTLFRWLDKKPVANSIDQLQDLVDQFDQIYNNDRPHQGLPGRITPAQAWANTPVVPEPEPVDLATGKQKPRRSTIDTQASVTHNKRSTTSGPHGHGRYTTGTDIKRCHPSNGTVAVGGCAFHVPRPLWGQEIRMAWDNTGVLLGTLDGEVVAEYNWPPVGRKYARKADAKWLWNR